MIARIRWHRHLPLLSGSRLPSELLPSANASSWIVQWKGFTFPTSSSSALKMSASPRAHCIPSFPAALSWSACCLKTAFGVVCLRISSNSLTSIGVGAGRRRGNLQLLQEVIIVDAPCLERFLYLGKPMNLTVISAPKLETLGCLIDEWSHPSWLVFGTASIQVVMAFYFPPMKRLLVLFFCYTEVSYHLHLHMA